MRFNFSVRNGKRWSPHAVITLVSFSVLQGRRSRRPRTLCRQRSVHTGSVESSTHGRLTVPLRVYVVVSLPESRAISTARLSVSPHVHLRPIDVVVSDGPCRNLILEPASCLDAFSTYPAQTRLPGRAPGGTTGSPEVCPTRSSRTSVGSPQISAPTTDRDRTVSRRSEPSSRATLMGEQPNPWDLLQPRDVTSRHRGAKPLRRYELLGGISLLSPEYLLSFERWPFHAEPPDHYALVSYLIDLSVSQSSALVPLHSAAGYQSA